VSRVRLKWFKKEKTAMKKNIVSVLKTLTAWAALAICVAYAQSSTVIAKVPFDFVVANRNMEPGDYRFTIDLVQATILVRGVADDSAAFVLSCTAPAGTTYHDAKLVFHRYGERYFLSQVWPAGVADGRQLPQSAKERELAMNRRRPEIVALIVKAGG